MGQRRRLLDAGYDMYPERRARWADQRPCGASNDGGDNGDEDKERSVLWRAAA